MTATAPSFLGTARGRLTLTLLCAIAFLDFIDASIVNVALPAMRADLHFSMQDLQWVPSGYLLTYGGFMLLGGRAADLLGRRRVVVAGTVLFGASSVVGGLAGSPGLLIAARLAQGVGAALMLPATLSILTTAFQGPDRAKALGVWGGVGGGASAAGVLLGGLLTDGPGWRWVMLVNPPVCVLVLVGVYLLVDDDRRTARLAHFDLPGAILATGGMLLLVFTLIKAPDAGWDTARTIGGLAGAFAVLAVFLLNERRARHPLLPLSIFRIRGLAAADVTQLIAMAGFLAMFFFLSLYMENVLGYSPLQTGAAYLPLCAGVGIAAGVTAQLIPRTGTRPLIIAGLLIAAAGLYLLSRVPVDGTYLADLLPGLLVASAGLGLVFVAVTTAANAGVPVEQAGLAASLINASQQLGGAVGLAVFSALAAARTTDLAAGGRPVPEALTGGFHRALLGAAVFVAAAAVVALRAANTRGEHEGEHEEDASEPPAAVPAAEPLRFS
ncbi:MFS transporter [Actinomadura macrotermitis]|uniref:Multidrug resistance protein Stp n=1 Tax=Actinomadura macrotermitis TaxID=2585200 RepID=A0A7K0BZ91_9ACTN|nr:MFS transporter [Actinomadura macrotermitis]MQY06499.1 Multidrug resistance protein Stp [Actinomadura macrotermitis]